MTSVRSPVVQQGPHEVGVVSGPDVADAADELGPVRIGTYPTAFTDGRPRVGQQLRGDLDHGPGGALASVEGDDLLDETVRDRLADTESQCFAPVSGRVVAHREHHAAADARRGDTQCRACCARRGCLVPVHELCLCGLGRCRHLVMGHGIPRFTVGPPRRRAPRQTRCAEEGESSIPADGTSASC